VWLVRFFSGILMFAGIVFFSYNVLATVLGEKTETTAA
jgi:cbb3-type cytochrome oxidase subunit 1